jgi:hypothetical protein
MNTSMAADIDLVVYNISKNISGAQVATYLANKGLHIKDCTLLTTSNEARMLSYKITVSPDDAERATNDEKLLPYGVGVRFYKRRGPRANNATSPNVSQDNQNNSYRTAGNRYSWQQN